MNEKIFEFLRAEIAAETDTARKSRLMTIEGYLKAAKSWRERCTTKRGSEYSTTADAERFDIDCARAER